MEVSNKKIRQCSFKYHSSVMTIEELLAAYKYCDYDFKELKNSKEVNKKIKLKIKKINQLYIEENTVDFQIQNINLINEGKSFITKKNVNKNKRDKLIESHLLGNQTIGCYPADSEHQKYFLFDIDVVMGDSNKNNICNKNKKIEERILFLARKYSKKIIKTLEKYIPSEYIHCYISGSKGYHVIVYLEHGYSRQIIQEFQKKVIELAKLNNIKNGNIEILPYIVNKNSLGKTAKIPLGRNFKNLEYGCNYCYFVDTDKLQYIPLQDDYFLSIKQMNIDLFSKSIKNVLGKDYFKKILCNNYKKSTDNINLNRKVKFNARKDVINFLKGYSITRHSERHDMTYDIILRLKDRFNLDKEESERYISQWIKWQKGKYNSTENEAKIDTINQLNTVYRKSNMYGLYNKENYIIKKDMENLINIRNSKGKIDFNEKNAMIVFLALIVQRKLTNSEEFFMSYTQMIQLTKVKRNYINPCLKRLEKLGKISIIDRVNYYFGQAKANRYRINFDIHYDTDLDTKYKVYYGKIINIYELLYKFYEDDLIYILSKGLYNKLLKSLCEK